MWSKNIITEAAVDVVRDVSGGGGSTSAIVYTVNMSHDPQMTSAFCLPWFCNRSILWFLFK